VIYKASNAVASQHYHPSSSYQLFLLLLKMASNTSFNKHTTGHEVAEAYSSQCAGKIVLITGVSPGGIGEATARAFAHGGASTVIITGRNDARLSAMNKKLAEEYPQTTFRPLMLNMNSLAAVRTSAQQILDDESIPQIDILVANAGGNTMSPRTFTADGLETHFGVNHIAHFLFITLLLPKLLIAAKKSAPGATRVVTVSSEALIVSPVRFSDYNFDGKPVPEAEKPDFTVLTAVFGTQETDQYDPTVAYAASKTANVLFAVQLNKLFADQGIYAFSNHPGTVDSTPAAPLWQMISKEQKAAMLGADGIIKTIEQGAATNLVTALDPGLRPEAGVYFADCQVADLPGYAEDEVLADRLWKLSEEIVGGKVGL
jgi:NAD(P)-dependent dehydrogenase (short-subunit alcohol dehydrogenase family)